MTDPQTHLIYLLLDSNLPTGGFVASSGLESWAKHGFLSPDATGYDHLEEQSGRTKHAGQGVTARRMTEFVDAELENFVSATGCFVQDAWEVGEGYVRGNTCGQCGKRRRSRPSLGDTIGSSGTSQSSADNIDRLEKTLKTVVKLDKYHEATLLSHVSRRASKAQGVAILTLFTKGLSRPPGFGDTLYGVYEEDEEKETIEARSREEEERAAELVEGYKRLIRKGSTPGHLAVCWGIMTAALGLSLGESHTWKSLHVCTSVTQGEGTAETLKKSHTTSTSSCTPVQSYPPQSD